MCQKYRRINEAPYAVTPWIHEFWCTVSNAPFIIIGLARLAYTQSEWETKLCVWFILLGVGSAIHHGIRWRYSIVLDWIPIIANICIVLSWWRWLWWAVAIATWAKLYMSLLVLANDHIFRVVPGPWGHACWHIMAAFAIDSLYQDIRHLDWAA